MMPDRKTKGTAVARPICGAKTKSRSGVCQRVAGFATDHVGQGKCRLHGGATPIKHGRYSLIKRDSLKKLLAEHAADPEPLDLRHELDLQRANLEDYINRQKDDDSYDPAVVQQMIEGITRTVERIERIRSEFAMTWKEFRSFTVRMGMIVDMEVRDDQAKERIRDGWENLLRGAAA